MPIEILGMIATTPGSEVKELTGPVVDAAYVREFSRAHEDAGFDRILIGYSASSPDGFAVASAALHATENLKVLIAHRPGFVAPTVVARKLATLDHLTGGGRVAIHHISGGSEADQRRDGDFSEKADRYRRTGEFIDVLRRTLVSEEPFDHHGDFYRVEGAYSGGKPATDAGIPIFFGGLSDGAIDIGAKGADVYMLFGEPLADVAEHIRTIRAAAAKQGRTIEFSLSTRPTGRRPIASTPMPSGCSPRRRPGTPWRSLRRPAASGTPSPPSACSSSPGAAMCTMSGSGPASRDSWGHRAIRPLPWAPRSRSRRRC